jgi:MoaA/NifB/PqqE/SkfB family radical SAM enzyme
MSRRRAESVVSEFDLPATEPARTVASLWLELEPRCNLRCQFCYNYWKDGQHPVPRRLPTVDLLRCLDGLLDAIECEKAALSGGEPLLYPGLDDVLEYLVKRGIKAVLTTNGVLLTEERLEHLVSLGLEAVQVPLHAATAAKQDELTGGRSWEASIRALLLARRLSVPVTPVFVATRKNLAELPRVVELLYLLGIHRLIVNRFVPGGLGLLHHSELWFEDADLVAQLVATEPVARRLRTVMELGVPLPVGARERGALGQVVETSCPVGAVQTQLTVDSEGNLKECSQSPAVLGNLTRETATALLTRRPVHGRGEGDVTPCKFCPSGGGEQVSFKARKPARASPVSA